MQLLHSELLHAPPSHSRAGTELRALAELGWPLVLASLGQSLLSAISTSVVGRLGAEALGGVGLGSSLFFTIAVIGLGVMLGLDPIIANAVGAGDEREARRSLAQGVAFALLLAVPLGLLTVLASYLLEPFGIETQAAAHARAYVLARAPSLLPYLALVPLRSYLGAANASRSVLGAVMVSNLCMLGLAPVLVSGGMGAPAWGTAGAGLAESLCTLIQLGVLIWAVRRRGPALSFARFDRELVRVTLRIGIPLGLGLLAEFAVFALVNLLVGRFDPKALGAHQIAITLAGTAFMVPVGLGGAAAARVGTAAGRGDRVSARLSGAFGIAIGGALMSVVAAAFLVAPARLASILTTDVGVIDQAVPLLAIAALFQVSDGIQVVAAASLRGVRDTRFTLGANLLGHYAIGLPLGLFLGAGLGLGARGLWWGLALGISVVAIALTLRFIRLSARSLARA